MSMKKAEKTPARKNMGRVKLAMRSSGYGKDGGVAEEGGKES